RFAPATDEVASELEDRLRKVEPLGTTRLVHALTEARAAAARAGAVADRVRIVYLGDGIATVGELDPGRLASAAGAAVDGARLTTVSLGGEVDQAALQRLASAGEGAHVDVVAAGGLSRAARRVLARQWGEPVRDVELVLPEGVTEVAPATLGELW